MIGHSGSTGMTQLTEETTSTSALVTAQAESARRHCWECLRRRLVCDSARPVCNRCRTNGIVCPGYGEQQPLRWVKPGRVSARNRRRPKVGGAKNARVAEKTPESTSSDADVDTNESNRPSKTSRDYSDDSGLQENFSALSLFTLMQPRVLDAIKRYDIKCENFAGLEASYIYNVEMYERSTPLKLLQGESRFKLPMASIAQLLPAPIQGLFILFALGHQMYNLPQDTEEDIRAHARSAIAFWTCQVVRTLNEDISQEKTRTTDGTLTGVLMLMMADQQIQPSSRWRFHYNGLMKMVRLRGGVEKIWHERPHMHSAIQTWVMGEVFANTTTPSNDQLAILTHPKNFEFVQTVWSTIPPVYIGTICPPALVPDIIRINHLRALASRSLNTPYGSNSSSPPSLSSSSPSSSFSSPYASEDDMPIYTDVETLLGRIISFSPQSYADENGTEETRDKWLLVARIHQSAVVLYCILSLQDVLLLPESKELEQTVNTHYDRLLIDLKKGFQYVNFKNCFIWPLIAAGASAVRGTAFERSFIADLLNGAVSDMGSSMPNLARKVLMAFWGSGKKGWDDCFDQPYLFIL